MFVCVCFCACVLACVVLCCVVLCERVRERERCVCVCVCVNERRKFCVLFVCLYRTKDYARNLTGFLFSFFFLLFGNLFFLFFFTPNRNLGLRTCHFGVIITPPALSFDNFQNSRSLQTRYGIHCSPRHKYDV